MEEVRTAPLPRGWAGGTSDLCVYPGGGGASLHPEKLKGIPVAQWQVAFSVD